MASRTGHEETEAETAARAEILAQRLSQLETEPEDGEAIRSLLELYEQRVASETTSERKAALWSELATLCQQAGSTYGAVAALERARARAPEDVRLAHALASALVDRSAEADGPTKAIYLDRVADLLCDVASALEPKEAQRFLHSALGHAPWHARALYALERATSAEDRGSLAGFWVAYLAHNPDGDLARERRVSLARAYIDAGQEEDAVFALEPAARQGDSAALALLAELRPESLAANVADDADGTGRIEHNDDTPAPIDPDALARAVLESLNNEGTDPGTRGSAPVTLEDNGPDEQKSYDRRDHGDDNDHAPLHMRRSERPVTNLGLGSRRSSAPPPLPNDGSEQALYTSELTEPSANAGQSALRSELKAASAAGDVARATQFARDLARVDPNDDLAFEYLEREFRRTRDHRARAEFLLETAQPDEVPRAKRKQRLRDAIALFEQKLADPDGAVRAYRALLQIEPDNDEVLRGLARVLERSGQWDALCECYERMLVLSVEPAQKGALLRRIADVHRRERRDRAAAAAALSRLIDLDANDRGARIALTEDYTALQRWDELARLYERRVDEPATKAERVALLRQLAELFEGPLSDAEAAFEAYERIVALAPDDAAALTRMEEIDEHSGDYERLLITLARRMERAAPTQGTQTLQRMAAISENNLQDPERAHRYLRQALDLSPSNGHVATALADVCERTERHAELLLLLRERTKTEKQPKVRVALLRRTARLLADKLADQEGAAGAFAALNAIEDDLEAWTFLELHARMRIDNAELSNALKKLETLETDPERRRERLFERSLLLAQLGQHVEAQEPLIKVLTQIDADDRRAREHLEALCTQLSDYRSLAQVLEDLLAATDDPARRAALASELSELYVQRVPDERREQKALLAWSQAAPREPAPWRSLARNYERRKRYQELLEAQDTLARLEPDSQTRAAALLAAADLCVNRLKDDPGTLERVALYARETSAGHEPLPRTILDVARKAGGLVELCDLCESTGRYQQLCELLRERIELCVDPERKAELYRRLATAQIEHLQDEQAALAAYEGLLVLTDDADALHFVQAWASRHEDPKRLAEVLSRLARIEEDPTERRDLWLERGRILRSQLDDPAAALDAFEEALAIDPNFVPALDEVLLASELAVDNLRLARGLEHKLKLEALQPVHVLTRLADLYEGPLADDDRAIDALTRWVSREPKAPVPLRRLRTLYKRQQRTHELLDTLDALARCEEERALRIEATVAAAELAHTQLADTASAFARLAPLVPACDPAADRALLSVAERSGRLEELYSLLEHAERFADLAYHLERAARHSAEPQERAGYLRRAAVVLHTHLNDVERTGTAYAELLTIEEDVAALRFMQARALEAEDVQAACEFLLRLSQQETEPQGVRDRLFDYAHLQHFHLQAPSVAIPVLQRILSELDPEFEPALDELLRAAESAADTTALAFGLNRRLERESNAQHKARYAERLADLYELQLHDDERAQLVLELWLQLDPDNLPALRRLRALHERHERHAELLVYLDRIAAQSERPEEQREVAFAAARLCMGPLADLDSAFARLTALMRAGAVQAEDALHKLAFERGRLEELGAIYEQSGRYDEVCELLRKRADAEPDVSKRAELWLRSARILANTVHDEFAAAEAYRQVLALRQDQESLQFLRKVAERQDDIESLEQVLAQLARASIGQERLNVELARALLLRDRLGQAAEACELLRKLLEDVGKVQSDFVVRDQVVTALEITAEQTDDRAALALALEARLETLREGTQRRSVALHLADLYEAELADPDRAATALRHACSADPRHLAARRRLKTHLARQGAYQEYVTLLDTLVHLEPNPSDRRDARLAAARAAHEHLRDSAGALTRLGPLVQTGDVDAERLGEEIARASGLGRELAAFYIIRARQAASPAEAEGSWLKVMTIHEDWLEDAAEAFEAALRLLAASPHNRAYLEHVDRLGTALQAFKRLASIYAKLVRGASSEAARVELNLRLSRLLEVHGEGQGALEYAMHAARSAPGDAQLVDRVLRLATSQSSASELFWAQEQRAQAAADAPAAIAAWLEAARTADQFLRDREQAVTCLRRALALTEHCAEQAPALLQVATDLDAARPELGDQDARRSLLRAHLELAEQVAPEFRTQLVLRAARFATDALSDDRTGFDILRGGAALPPFSEELLDVLEHTAKRINRLDAFDAQLARSAERSETIEDKQRLLRRRARVLTDQLERYDQAAQVYERLQELAPDDGNIAAFHLQCLRKAGRHRELLRACERRLPRVEQEDAKLALMREMATIWEVELKNRASALAIWTDVHALAPQNEEASRAVERLQAQDAP